MIDLLVKLYIAVALLQLGLSVSELANCNSRDCVQMFENKSRDVLKIDWKPISVFPEEAGNLSQLSRQK